MSKLSRILTAILVAAMVVYAGVVTLVEESKPVLPPERFAPAMYISWASEPMNFEELVEEAEYIAHIRVGDWIGNSDYHANVYFEATAVEVFKGDLPERFILSQDTHIVPTFTYGNELFLFMMQASYTEHDVVYRTVDSDRDISYVAYDADGGRYIVPARINRAMSGFISGGAVTERAEIEDWLIQNDPEFWQDRNAGVMHHLDAVVNRIATILAETSLTPPEVSISVDGEVITLEPFSYSWKALRSPNKHRENTLSGTSPLELTDEEWNALPYVKGEPSEVEVLCRVEPRSARMDGYHESYRRDKDSQEKFFANPTSVNKREDGIFEIESDSGYLYIVNVSWNSDPGSDAPLYKGHAQYAFRVGKTKKIAADKVTLASFDEYPTAQLSNLLRGTPRADIIELFGEPDIDAEGHSAWMRDDGKLLYLSYGNYPEYDESASFELTEGLRVPPPMLITVGGESYRIETGTTTWRYCAYDDRWGGFESCSSAPEDWDWSERTIYTDSREAVITLDVSERLAEHISLKISGAEITADGAGETFSLYPGTFLYKFTASIREKCDEDERPLFSGTAHCAFRVVVDY